MVVSSIDDRFQELRDLIWSRFDESQAKLDAVLKALDAQKASLWIDRKAACGLLGVSDRHLRCLIEQGVIHGEAVRNVGSVKRPRYRFNRELLLKQYLRRA